MPWCFCSFIEITCIIIYCVLYSLALEVGTGARRVGGSDNRRKPQNIAQPAQMFHDLNLRHVSQPSSVASQLKACQSKGLSQHSNSKSIASPGGSKASHIYTHQANCWPPVSLFQKFMMLRFQNETQVVSVEPYLFFSWNTGPRSS